MTKKSGVRKSQKQDLAKVLKQMDFWIQHQTNLSLMISTSLVQLMLFGRVVARLERLFLFEAHGEVCRVPIIPERYDRVRRNQKGPASVTLENASGMAGELRLAEDLRGTEQRGEEAGPQVSQPPEELVAGA
jgi:hypothetical protein